MSLVDWLYQTVLLVGITFLSLALLALSPLGFFVSGLAMLFFQDYTFGIIVYFIIVQYGALTFINGG